MSFDALQPQIVRMPELADGHWLNTPVPLKKDRLRNQVVLIDFWDYTCINCIRTLPYLVAWHKRYHSLGLTIIGIHTPEFKFAQTKTHIEQAIAQFDIEYPILLDNQYENWSRFTVKAWPTKVLVDGMGYIRYQNQGEGYYQKTESAIQQLLKLQNPDITLPELLPPLREEDSEGAVCFRPTPELYAGYQGGGLFAGGLGNESGYVPDQTIFYEMPPVEAQENGRFYLSGAWRAWPEAIAFGGQHGGKIRVPYSAATINAVMAPSADPVELALGLRPTDEAPIVEVRQDGRWLNPLIAGKDVLFDENGRSYIKITNPQMFQLVNNHIFKAHLLELTFQANGLALFAFSFSSCISGNAPTNSETFTVK